MAAITGTAVAETALVGMGTAASSAAFSTAAGLTTANTIVAVGGASTAAITSTGGVTAGLGSLIGWGVVGLGVGLLAVTGVGLAVGTVAYLTATGAATGGVVGYELDGHQAPDHSLYLEEPLYSAEILPSYYA